MLCIVGAEPRRLSVVERLCANERAKSANSAVTMHVVEPHEPSAGAVWRTDQPRRLLMNTVAPQITVHPEASSRVDGPVEPGPGLAEWAKSLVLSGSASGRDNQTLAEARDLNQDSCPTRALYGSYQADIFQRVVRRSPGHVTVEIHHSHATVLTDSQGVADGRQAVGLGDGTWLRDLDAVVMTQGHVPVRLTVREQRTASLADMHGLIYVPPANPADLDVVAPGEVVLLRGLGLNFFDHMTLLTQGRGGTFTRVHGRLTYRSSGQEPRLYASSRRGILYHARGENEKGASDRYYPQLLPPEFIAALRDRQGRRIDLRAELWPLTSWEVEGVYYGTWLAAQGRGADRTDFVNRYLGCADATGRRALLDAHAVPDADRWNWEALFRPYNEAGFSDRKAFQVWLLDYLRRDVQEASAGKVSGLVKAALDVLAGPATEIRIDAVSPAFVTVPRTVPGPPVRARVLIEARLHEPDIRRTTEPLLRHLLSTGQARNHRVPTAHATDYETGGLAVTERPYRLIDARGHAHPRRFCYSVPTEGVHWVTAAGIRPGVDSVTLADSDAIARAVLALAPCSDLSAAAPGFQGALV
ncbi:FAD/NAD(P)-binding protein [Streptomyces sp. NPDC002285]